jgi:hypothetical protein
MIETIHTVVLYAPGSSRKAAVLFTGEHYPDALVRRLERAGVQLVPLPGTPTSWLRACPYMVADAARRILGTAHYHDVARDRQKGAAA